MKIFAPFAVLAALLGAAVADLTEFAVCHEESGGSTTCPDGSATFAVDAQRVLGPIGVVPVLVFAFYAFRGQRRRAYVWLGISLVVWIAWGVLNDAAVHGWSRDMTLVP